MTTQLAIEDVIAEQRRALLAREQPTLERIAQMYRDAIAELERRAAALPEADTPSRQLRLNRTTILLAQLDDELARITSQSFNQSERLRRDVVALAPEHLADLLDRDAPLGSPPPEVRAGFNPDAIERIGAALQPSSPLAELLSSLSADTAAAARSALFAGVALGDNPRQIGRKLANTLDVSRSRAQTIARTETLRAYRGAIRQGMRGVGTVVGWRWIAARDRRTCAVCWAMHGQAFSLDEAMGTHPNAVLEGSTFVPYGRLQEMVAAEYSGPAIRLRTSGGHLVTIGPNHPMLTARGMIQARFLKEGDQLLYDGRHNEVARGAPRGETDFEKVPLVEDAFDALCAFGSHSRIAAASHNLHGDAVYCQQEIDVVRPERDLLLEWDSCGVEALREDQLVRANSDLALVTSGRASSSTRERISVPAAGGVGGGSAWRRQFSLQGIESIETVHFRGRAFDASTDSSLYCSSGFVVSNCRCSQAPMTSMDAITVARGSELFSNLPFERQLHVLGPAKMRAYQRGLLSLEQLVGVGQHPKWGTVRFERSLRDIFGRDLAREFYRPPRPPRPAPPRPRAAGPPPPRPVAPPPPRFDVNTAPISSAVQARVKAATDKLSAAKTPTAQRAALKQYGEALRQLYDEWGMTNTWSGTLNAKRSTKYWGVKEWDCSIGISADALKRHPMQIAHTMTHEMAHAVGSLNSGEHYSSPAMRFVEEAATETLARAVTTRLMDTGLVPRLMPPPPPSGTQGMLGSEIMRQREYDRLAGRPSTSYQDAVDLFDAIARRRGQTGLELATQLKLDLVNNPPADRNLSGHNWRTRVEMLFAEYTPEERQAISRYLDPQPATLERVREQLRQRGVVI